MTGYSSDFGRKVNMLLAILAPLICAFFFVLFWHKQRRIMSAVAESNAQSLVVFELAPIPILIVRSSGQLLKANRAWRGQHPSVEDYNVLEDKILSDMGLTPAIEAALTSGRDHTCSAVPWPSADGQKSAWVMLIINAVPASSGLAQQFVIRFTDVSPEREQNLELARQIDLTQAILNNSQAVVYAKDLQGRYLFVNTQWETAISMQAKNVIGRTDHEVFSNDIATRFAEVDKQVLTERRGLRIEETAPHPDGIHVYLSAKFPIINAHGDLIALGGISTDMSALKKAEEERAQLVLREKSASEASRLKSIFLANMSHELRTPLNGVMGMADLLSRTSLTDQQKIFTSAIASSADALLVLVNDVLDLTQAEAGNLATEVVALDLEKILNELKITLTPLAIEKKLELKFSRAEDLNQVYLGDPLRVRQVLLSLARNAVKFTEKGFVHVRILNEQNSIRFEVEDSGTGVSAKIVPELFTSFSQGDSSSTRKFGGSGLGLAIAKNLVTLMGGEIGVVTPPCGIGAKFWFSIPLERAKTEAS